MTLQAITHLNARSIDLAACAAQNGTDTAAVVTGSELDNRPFLQTGYAIYVATNTLTWYVYGARLSTFADEVLIYSGDVLAGGHSTNDTASYYPYSRVKIVNKVAGSVGVATVTGLARGF
jgi:hypothetical protein